MSKREQVQEEIAGWIREHQDYFDAPYGVIEGLQKFGRGKKRTVTFGVSRYLDAEVSILGENKINLFGRGGIAKNWGIEYRREFSSVDELIEFLSKKIGKR